MHSSQEASETVLDPIIKELGAYASHKDTRRFMVFFSRENEEQKLAKELLDKLHLSNTMSISQLRDAILLLESIPVTGEKGSPKNFKALLEEQKIDSFQDIKLSNDKLPNPSEMETIQIPLQSGSNFAKFLTTAYVNLFGCYTTFLIRVSGEAPVSSVDYTEEMLERSQIARDMERTSKLEYLPDQALVIGDMIRAGVTIEGKAAATNNRDDFSESNADIVAAIEAFTGDEIKTPGSKADKILHFGGQNLEGELLKVFSSSVTLKIHDSDEELQDPVQPGETTGHIDWKKNTETGEITADVQCKIFNCTYAGPEVGSETVFYAMATDGRSLIKLDDDSFDVLLRAKSERQGKTTGEIVPLAEMKMTVKLELDNETNKYFLKVGVLSAQFNTTDMVARKMEPEKKNNIFGP